MATKSYFIAPEDGWVNVTTIAAKAAIRISAYPHTHPFRVYAGTSAPALTVPGIRICHKAFQSENSNATGNVDAFYVRVDNPANQGTNGGKLQIDVFIDGGALV